MDVQSYLDRINFSHTIKIELATLIALQEAHLFTIPFENLDIHYGNRIILDLEKIYTKIITHKRGGFCYELNGLFHKLLVELGFEAKMISAKVHIQDETYGQEFDHLAIMATVNSKAYLVDVGFGAFTINPLEFKLHENIEDQNGTFLFDKYDDDYFRVSALENDTTIPQYIFKTNARQLNEFENMCDYHQNNSASHFTQKKVISIPSKTGRITLNDNQLKIKTNHNNKVMVIQNQKTFNQYLWEYFKIKIQASSN